MIVVYTPHLKKRLEERQIPKDYPKRIYYRPDFKFFDAKTERLISIKKLFYNERNRYMMISFDYDKINKEIRIITIHPENKKEIDNRVSRRRYLFR